jgi:ectoine hydroxylase-related dioxygenase (phytanoyl-CoA dioxygenase family)
LLDQNPDRRPEELGHELVTKDPFWVRLVSDDRLLDIVEELIGPDIALFASHYIAKPPGDGQPVLWHQDGAYWPIEPTDDVVTMWLALDQTRTSNGAMEVIPGTQELELREIEEDDSVDSVLGSKTTIDVNTDDARTVELEPGDASLHHPNVLHGSQANRSYNWRRGLTIRYMPPTTAIEDYDAASQLMLRGDPDPETNDYEPWPIAGDEDFDFDGEDAYNERARERNERIAELGSLLD